MKPTARTLALLALAAAGCLGEEKEERFTLDDLVGTWDRIVLSSSDNAGWRSETLTVDVFGRVVFTACEVAGAPTCPNTATPVYAIDKDGNVTASGNGANGSLHLTMRSRKDLMVGTASSPATSPFTSFQLLVYRKRTGATFAPADVGNLAFAYHGLKSGAESAWDRGIGVTDANGAVTISAAENSTGTGTPPAPGSETWQVNPEGRVTRLVSTSYRGLMTSDRKLIFGVRTITTGVYQFSVHVVTGGMFKQADLTGSWSYHSLNSGVSVGTSGWGRGTFTADVGGNLAFTSSYNPQGPQSNTGFTLAVAPDGSTSRADYASYKGQLAAGNDLFVRTQTQQGSALSGTPPNGPPSLSINVR